MRHVRPAAPVVIVLRQQDFLVRGVRLDRVRPGAAVDAGLEVGLVRLGRIERRRADDPGPIQRRGDEVHRRGVLEGHRDRRIGRADRVEGRPDEARATTCLGGLDRLDDGGGIDRCPIVERGAVAQLEGPGQAVSRRLPGRGQRGGVGLGARRIDPQQRLVDVGHVQGFGGERLHRIPGGHVGGRGDLEEVRTGRLARWRSCLSTVIGGSRARARALSLRSAGGKDQCSSSEQRDESRGAMRMHRFSDLLHDVADVGAQFPRDEAFLSNTCIATDPCFTGMTVEANAPWSFVTPATFWLSRTSGR